MANEPRETRSTSGPRQLPWLEPWGIGFFVSPLPLMAVALTAMNDHVLKNLWPSFVTGKLSDLAGVFFTPLFALAVMRLIARKRVSLTLATCVIVMIVFDVLFVLLKMNRDVRDAYVGALESIGITARSVMDPTDLIAMLVANVGTFFYVKRELDRTP